MLFLTEKINVELPNEDKLHSFLKDIPDDAWEGWTITRKGNTRHLDFKRDRAKLIPIGPNKGEIHYHLHWKWKPFYTYKYTGPTITRTNWPHSVKNETGNDRYVIQIDNSDV